MVSAANLGILCENAKLFQSFYNKMTPFRCFCHHYGCTFRHIVVPMTNLLGLFLAQMFGGIIFIP